MLKINIYISTFFPRLNFHEIVSSIAIVPMESKLRYFVDQTLEQDIPSWTLTLQGLKDVGRIRMEPKDHFLSIFLKLLRAALLE